MIAVAAVVGASLLGAGTANAGVKDKHAGKAQHSLSRFLGCGSEVECDGNGGAAVVTRVFGIAVSTGGTVPNSLLCQ